MAEEKVLLQATLVFPIRAERVLLALKARTRKIGAGFWNGYGGGINEGEDPASAAIRELREESGLSVESKDLEKVAVIDFHNTKSDGTTFVCQVHTYLAKVWNGEAKETEEMLMPTWYSIKELPLYKMMPADREWFPLILQGKKIIATARYGPFQKELLGLVEIREVSCFD